MVFLWTPTKCNPAPLQTTECRCNGPSSKVNVTLTVINPKDWRSAKKSHVWRCDLKSPCAFHFLSSAQDKYLLPLKLYSQDPRSMPGKHRDNRPRRKLRDGVEEWEWQGKRVACLGEAVIRYGYFQTLACLSLRLESNPPVWMGGG